MPHISTSSPSLRTLAVRRASIVLAAALAFAPAFAPALALIAVPAASTAQPTASLSLNVPRPRSGKPIIAVVADAGGTELTDLVVPRATLTESGAARVITVAAQHGKIPLVPSTLTIEPEMTFAAFDSTYPAGADYVIVPAMKNHRSKVVYAWLRAQASRGATIVAICEGARVVAGAGLLDGKRATTHWHALAELQKQYPRTTWVRNARYVVDERRMTTAGVSASLPFSIFLVERIAGKATADSLARRIGVKAWGPTHDSDAFHISRGLYAKGLMNYAAWWRHDVVAVHAANGVDEIALALTMDAIPRTIRGKPLAWSDSGGDIVGRQGLRISVNGSRAAVSPDMKTLPLPSPASPPAIALDSALVRLTGWYGETARELVTLGLEYPTRRAR